MNPALENISKMGAQHLIERLEVTTKRVWIGD